MTEKFSSAEEAARAQSLLEAQNKAVALFEEIEKQLLRPGISEKQLNQEIYDLGEQIGVRSHWHKRVIRSGPNTLSPFLENPPDRIIEADDILVVDLGPVFEAWEADFGRTYVLGNDPHKIRLRDALEPIWYKVKKLYWERPDMTGEELYDIACAEAEKEGFKFGADLAGHIVGSFPHERIPQDKIKLYVKKGNSEKISSVGKDGHKRHWILEIHLHDPVHGFGGFYEQLMTIH
ncbi:peptidase M24 structural domain-containing protein [Penicillium argentinense]|uniref:Peptidase M24 structural domain-containing protein n=1 Tax=Penicillium argentinense TaxID=1131581 RepID=A0A9W9JV80_9EURO|nr:peptidase M24 structural domain-containing protein [Penicillium argentinense]KAJ5082621.1 peptidase M24 structural domain-containing protein [Penicillium argentinense]